MKSKRVRKLIQNIWTDKVYYPSTFCFYILSFYLSQEGISLERLPSRVISRLRNTCVLLVLKVCPGLGFQWG